MLDAPTINQLSGKFIVGTLIFIRVTAMFFVGPIFSHSSVQPTVKIGLSIIMAMMMTVAFGSQQPSIDLHLWVLTGLAFKELLVGAALGFTLNMIFYAVRFAGGLLDFDIGFQTALLFDQNADVPTLIGELKNMIALMIFLGMNGHHFMIEAMFASIRAVPLAEFAMTESASTLIIRLVTTVTIIALKIAAPVLLSLFVMNVSLALLSRVAPQLNIFSLSLQFKVIVGLLVLFVTMPLFFVITKTAMTTFQNESFAVIMALNPKR
ncbi:MAG: flagellar biosynthetic protein FliR [Candidatus Kapaibacterium sp.]